jgi:hypothetical protein
MAKKPSPKPRKAAKKAAAGPKKLRDRTPNVDDDHEAAGVRRMAKSPVMARAGASILAARVSGWRVARSLDKLLRQVNAIAPGRRKASDGAIGDTNHKNRRSDHNPWVIDGNKGVVTARDITHDPARKCDCNKLAESIRAARDRRVKYIIWNRRICNSSPIAGVSAWTWRRYRGANGHTHHIHISVKPLKSLYDSETAWSLAQM